MVVDDESRSREELGVTRSFQNGANIKKWTAQGEDRHEAGPVPSGDGQGIGTFQERPGLR
jgi:hypothetical protein